MSEQAQNLQGAQVIAKIFGVSVRRVEQLKAEGVIQGSGKPTRYDLLPTIQAYIKYLSDKANGREKKENIANLTESKLDAETRFKTAKAQKAELELKEIQGKMHRAEDVEAITTAHVMHVRSLLMGLPGKLAVDCANLSTPSEEAARITTEVNDVLRQLSEFKYDAEEYKKKVQERQGWEHQHEDEGEGAETE